MEEQKKRIESWFEKEDHPGTSYDPKEVYAFCFRLQQFEQQRLLEEEKTGKEVAWDAFLPLKWDRYLQYFFSLEPSYQWGFLITMHEEFSDYQRKGILNEADFAVDSWKLLKEVLDNPVRFFRINCKKYSMRPEKSVFPAELRKSSECRNPDISVVIPVYNDEKNILRSLRSAQRQTWKNIEIVCVDDGSDDRTLELLLNEAEKDKRITVFHQFNQGQSVARNSGFDGAKGRYVQYLDSDDELKENALEYLVKKADEMKLDILYFDGESTFESEELKEEHPFFLTGYEYPIDMPEPIPGREYYIRQKEDKKLRVHVGMALFRRDYLRSRGIRFPEGIVHEDNVYSFESMIGAERIWHTTEKFYIRFVHQGTTMTQKRDFFHVYGYFTCMRLTAKAAEHFDGDKRLQEKMDAQVENLRLLTRQTYEKVTDPEECRKKFTDAELFCLDELMKADKQIRAMKKENKKLKKELETIRNSKAYRIGTGIAAPLRKVRDMLDGE